MDSACRVCPPVFNNIDNIRGRGLWLPPAPLETKRFTVRHIQPSCIQGTVPSYGGIIRFRKTRKITTENNLSMEIKYSEFVISSPTVSTCPKDTKNEYAFIGRSNVGKSSLINMLCRRKNLAKTSATPGKTLLINHFIINKEWYLVDLPGYGFAKRSKTVQKKL